MARRWPRQRSRRRIRPLEDSFCAWRGNRRRIVASDQNGREPGVSGGRTSAKRLCSPPAHRQRTVAKAAISDHVMTALANVIPGALIAAGKSPPSMLTTPSSTVRRMPPRTHSRSTSKKPARRTRSQLAGRAVAAAVAAIAQTGPPTTAKVTRHDRHHRRMDPSASHHAQQRDRERDQRWVDPPSVLPALHREAKGSATHDPILTHRVRKQIGREHYRGADRGRSDERPRVGAMEPDRVVEGIFAAQALRHAASCPGGRHHATSGGRAGGRRSGECGLRSRLPPRPAPQRRQAPPRYPRGYRQAAVSPAVSRCLAAPSGPTTHSAGFPLLGDSTV